MATLVKTGIGDGKTLTPVMITELYDAFTGDKLFDNIILNNSMKVTHDGKVAISRPGFSKATPYALNVVGDIQGHIGRFNEVISDTMTFVTSSGLIVSGSNHFGGLDTHIHTFTGSLAISGSQDISNYFLNKVAIGRIDVTEDHMFEVAGGAKISTYVSASDLHIDETGSFGHLKVSGDAIINGNLTFGNSDADSVSFGAEINSHIIPDANSTYNLGSSGKRWSSLFVDTITTTNSVNANSVSAGIINLGSGKPLNIVVDNDQGKIIGNSVTSASIGRIEVLGNLQVNGTASFEQMEFSELISVDTASLGDVSISTLTVNNSTGSDNQLVKTSANGTLSFDWADRTSIEVKNVSGATLTAGKPIYISSFISDDLYGVDLADARIEDRRPAIGILLKDVLNNNTGSAIISGLARGYEIDTSAFSAGQKLFLGGDGLVVNEPTTPGAAVQQVGVCLKSSATDGEILIIAGGGGGSTEVLPINEIFLGSGSLTENIHISGALDRTSVNNITGVGTASFAHLIIDGNITASGTIRADAFESVTGGEAIDFKDSLNITGNLTASGDLSIDDLTASGRITALDYGGNISGSATSTGSFGHLHIANRIGIGITDPSSILHISGTDGLIIPVGTNAQRNSAPKQGEIRFNLDQSTYEGYDGDNWGSLGGMNDVDQDTKITAETSAGADNDELQFFTAGVERLRILADGHISASGNITASSNLEVHGNISSSASSTGSFGLVEIAGIDINPSGVARDQVLKFNGTNFVAADPDDTFVFTIADFDTNDGTTPQLIGSGSWKAVGDLTFTATYNNGPPDGFEGSSAGAPKIQGYVDGAISSSYDMFPLSSSFSTGTNPMFISFPPNSSDDIRFRLFASAGSDTDNEYSDQRIFFFNQFVYGELSKDNGFNQADIRTLAAANTVTSNDTTRTLSVSIGASNYLAFAHRTGDTNVAQVYSGNSPNRLTVAMDRSDATTITPLKETVSYLNTAGKTENFFVYVSKNQNIDAHSSTFITSTSTQKINYIYWGVESSWINNESNVEALDNKNSSYDDGSITGNTLSVGTFTSKFVIVAIPNRYGDNDTDYQFKDNSTNLPFDFTQQSDVTITNAVGFQEDYSVYKSTNQLTMTNATVLIDSV